MPLSAITIAERQLKRKPARGKARGLRLLLPVLLLLSLSRTLHGTSLSDPEYLIDVWETTQGLPEDSATAMVQTPDGYLWFGTFDGLVRFDGTKFTVFDKSNAPQLPSPAIVNLYLDHSGRMWVSTMLGLAYVKDGQWQTFNDANGWTGNYVRFFAESPAGDLYMSTFDHKIFQFHNNRFEQLQNPPADPNLGFVLHVDEAGALWAVNPQFIGKLVNGKWLEMISAPDLLKQEQDHVSIVGGSARDQGLWIATGRHLRKYKAGKMVFETESPWPMASFWSLTEDPEGNVWICSSNNGVYSFSKDGKWRHFTVGSGLLYQATRFVLEDHEGNWWIGTSGGGLHRFRRRHFRNWGVAEGLPEPVVKSVTSDGTGKIFLGTWGHGVVRLEDDKITPVLQPNGSTDSGAHCNPFEGLVFSTLADHNDHLWVGTLSEGLYFIDESTCKVFFPSREVFGGQGTSPPIYSLFEDSHGRIWIGTDDQAIVFAGNHFEKYPLRNAPAHSGVRSFAEDPVTGTIWAGNQAGGLYRLDDDAFVPAPEAAELASERISSLYEDSTRTLWMGTEDNGIACLRQGRLTRITQKQGLPTRSIGSIVADNSGNLWFGSNRGILRIARAELDAVSQGQKTSLNVQIFNHSDGLATEECSIGYQPEAVKDPGGNLWFATFRGVVVVDPKSVGLNLEPSPLVLQEVLLDGEPRANLGNIMTTDAAHPLSLAVPAGSHRLEIHFDGLNFAAPEKLRFRYRIEGLDSDWIDLDGRRVVYLQDLKPGNYRFRVQDSNNGGEWAETGISTQLYIYIQPHFYQTGWFLWTSIAGALLITAGLYRLHMRRMRNRAIELEQLVTQRTRELADEVQERKRAEAELSKARDELEERVKDRTAALENDIAQRKRVEEDLRHSEDKFAKAFHSSPAAMTITSLETGRLIDVNDAFLNLFGFHYEEVLGRDATQLNIWSDPHERLKFLSTLNERGIVRNQKARYRNKEGRPINALLSGEIVNFSGIRAMLAVILDVSEQSRLEDQLRQIQKMEAIGTLSGGVAHDFNNLLTVIRGYSHLLIEMLQGDAELRANAERIDEAAEKAVSLTRQLLAFSRQQVLQPRIFSLNTLLQSLELLLRRLIGEDIDIKIVTAPNLGSVKADPGQIEQVVMNLVVNARDAMPRGGSLTLETTNSSIDEDFARSHMGAKPGPYVLLSVSDTGTGMTHEVQARIFEPFFTTKQLGKGTGLGLSMVYGIVKQSGGSIWVYSEPDRGTTFKVYLPRIDAPVETTLTDHRPPANLRGNETILLVEDDARVRQLAQTVLSSCGYTVLVAEDVAHAEVLSKEYKETIHLLLTDVVMPRIGGPELAKKIVARIPRIKVLYMSGYAGDAIVHHGVLDATTPFLAKPFTPNSLASKVREILDAKS